MKFKKTITALTLSASSSAFSLMAPPVETKTICLQSYEGQDGSTFVGTCDQSRNNKILEKEILSNGCAKGQTALVARRYAEDRPFYPEIGGCMPPNVSQL